jgi:uncharacterized protein YbjT (DUF2867 family)
MDPHRPILVTGASGYVGGCLIPALLDEGYAVRVFVRDPRRIAGRAWFSKVEVSQGDLLSPPDLDNALQGVSTAYYLVHNMSSGRGHPVKEVESARNFALAAEKAGIDHIIYLGGLADTQQPMGYHLHSRLLTGETLRDGSVPVTEFRAGLVIGSGSISFEMVRYLVEQLPVGFGRRWLLNRTQPIAIRNILDYLLAALDQPDCRGKVYEIGGPDILTYKEVMQVYARVRGLKRLLVTLPWMPLDLMVGMASRLTPIPVEIAKPLIEGMRSDSLVQTDLAERDFPQVHLIDYPASIRQALEALTPDTVEWPWVEGRQACRLRQQGFFIEAGRMHIQASPQAVFAAVTSLGGKNGWYALDPLWKLRGWIDRLVGGPGLRGRASGVGLKEGDTLDFYRVECLHPGRFLRLRAELKAPGLGWMDWQVDPTPGSGSRLTQTAYFAPKGMTGHLYWYLLLPFHRLVFSRLLHAIAALPDKP